MVDLDAVLAGVREQYTPDADTQKRVRTAVTVTLAATGGAVATGTAGAASVGKAATTGATSAGKVAAGLGWGKLIASTSVAVALVGSGAWLWSASDTEPPAEVPGTQPASAVVATEAAHDEPEGAPAPPTVDEAPPSAVDEIAQPSRQPTSQSATRTPRPHGPAHGSTTPRHQPPQSEPARSTMLDELRMIGDASRALRSGELSRASQLLKEHGRRYPKSTLSTERGGLQLLVRCAQSGGQPSPSTRSAAERFVRAAPGSPLAQHIEKQCLK